MLSIHRVSSRLVNFSRQSVRQRGHAIAPYSLETNLFSSCRIRNTSPPAFSRRFTSSKESPKGTPKPSSSDDVTNDPTIWNNEAGFFNRKRFMDLNLSEMAGNLSSFLVLIAYTMVDIFALRVVSLVATSLALLFQYYRKIPLWIPIRWNLVLVLINATMVTKLHLEQQRAETMTPLMKELYVRGHFEQRGFSKVEFLRLYEMAKTEELSPGTVIVEKGRAKQKLHFLVEGSVDVSNNGTKLAQLHQFKFIGEISLLGRMLLKNMDTGASADVIVSPKRPAKFLVWELDELIPYLQEDRQVWNALASYLNYDLTSKLLRDGKIQPVHEDDVIPSTTGRGKSAEE